MAKFINILFVVILIAFISDEEIIDKVQGEECAIDVGFNICTSNHDRCLMQCRQTSFYLVYKAQCQIAGDGSTYCECIFNCIDGGGGNKLMVANSPSPQ
ncbi:hypothetical protein RND71_002471 [Anisodus tanguticus]|uniref:Uncharacterized protein n=1 Tax=Anisodus tanguticus TaxID=243964 RepID=A0AAE1T171_9SOLA|nr:hypothetical protein RND71_002471 [Anisodus tanguticus]